MMMKDAVEGRIALSEVPSVKRWNDEFFKLSPAGKRTVDRWTGHDVHHAVEKWIQEDYLDRTGGYDDCPGFVLNTKDHTFGLGRNADGTVAGDLSKAIKGVIDTSDPNRALLVGEAIRKVYKKWELDDLWYITREWLISKQLPVPPL